MPRSQSKELFEHARRLIPGGVNCPLRAFRSVGNFPLFIRKGHGSSMEDADGNRYIDYCQSWGALILGHAHPAVVEAVEKAARDGISFGACHVREIEFAELLLSALPDFDRVRIVNSGTEAGMTAVRIARAATGRDKLLMFEGGYHGHAESVLARPGSGLAAHRLPCSTGIPAGVAGDTLVASYDDEESVRTIFKRIGNRIAAVIAEPVPAHYGLLEQRSEFVRFLREITRHYGALLVFDEIVSGFRMGFGGYYAQIGVIPDLLTLGKIIGGGFSIGAVVGKLSVMDLLSPVGGVFQAGALSGNPVALAAGLATLAHLQDEMPYALLERLGKHFEETLRRLSAFRAQVRRIGSMAWLYLDNGPLPRRPEEISSCARTRFVAVYGGMLDRGIYLPPSPLETMFISTAHTPREVEQCATVIAELLQRGGAVEEGSGHHAEIFSFS